MAFRKREDGIRRLRAFSELLACVEKALKGQCNAIYCLAFLFDYTGTQLFLRKRKRLIDNVCVSAESKETDVSTSEAAQTKKLRLSILRR